MKELIKTGSVVDDGTGDYLRKGGEKINNNFNLLFNRLGDDNVPHESGAWKTVTSASVDVDFGRSLALNTTNNKITVNLPKGKPSDYNKTIKLRDVWGTWSKNIVTLVAANGDTIRGFSKSVLSVDLMDVELVYCSPSRWEYVANKRVDKITNSDLSTVAVKSFIAKQGQTDFNNIFVNDRYNVNSVEVYYRGNLLYYGDQYSNQSEYGSKVNGVIGELNGNDISLKFPCDEGDTVTIKTYMDGIASWRTSYVRHDLTILDKDKTSAESLEGSVKVDDLSKLETINLEEFGVAESNPLNPNSFEVYLNGVLLSNNNLSSGYCSLYGLLNQEECESIGGEWIHSNMDYETNLKDGAVNSITFAKRFNHGDMVTIKSYNNVIGSIMKWDDIKEKSEELFLNTEQVINRNVIEYTDYDNPSQKTMRRVPEQINSRVSTLHDLFDIIYPIGTIYTNAHNPDNPAKYMGLGMWKRYMEGRVLASWSSDPNDSVFGLNNNDLDVNGVPSHTAGGTGGERSIKIEVDNIPRLDSENYVLVKDSNGSVVIGACEFDPGITGPDLKKYTEEILSVNKNVTTPTDIKIIQPYVTAHLWIRVA